MCNNRGPLLADEGAIMKGDEECPKQWWRPFDKWMIQLFRPTGPTTAGSAPDKHQALEEVLMGHNDRGIYQCKRCEGSYQGRTSIAQHVKRAHPISDAEKLIICQLAGEGLTSEAIGKTIQRAPSTVGRYMETQVNGHRRTKIRSTDGADGNNPPTTDTIPATGPMPSPAEFVMAFETRVLEYRTILAQKDTQIAELTRANEAKEKEIRDLAKQLNDLLYRGKSFSDQMAAAGQIIRSPLAR